MAQPIRLPLVEQIEPRLADSSKDGLASNVFYDKNTKGDVFAVKRPGITSYASATGTGLGIFLGYGWTIPYAVWPKIIWTGSMFAAPCHDFFPTLYSTLFIYSTDGINWKQSTLPASAAWEGVAWNGTNLCVCSQYTSTTNGGSIATSPDGITWTARTIADGAWKDVESNGTNFVVIGTGNTLGFVNSAYSTDNGVTWTTSNLDTSFWTEVAWNSGAGLFCAVDSSPASIKVATSPTGAVWTNRTIAAGVRATIASNGTIWFTPADSEAKGYISSDGITWTQVTLPAARGWIDVSWTGTQFVMTALNTNILTVSSDGITWTEVTMPTLVSNEVDTSLYTSLAGNSNITVVLGDGPYYYSYSEDNNSTFTLNNLNRYSVLPTITP